MDSRTISSSNVDSVHESPNRVEDRQANHPSAAINRPPAQSLEAAFRPDLEKKTKALQWALKRVAGRSLPGEGYVEEYLRDMYRRNCRPNTFKSALLSIETFLLSVAESGKTRLETITKTDLEAFIERNKIGGS